MEPQDFAWVQARHDRVIDRDHPDYEYWQEAAAIEDWIADGAPPLDAPEPLESQEAAELPTRPQQPDAPSVVLAVGPDQAAAFLSVSRDYFDQHIKPGLKVVKLGRRVLVTVRELERWLSEHEARALQG